MEFYFFGLDGVIVVEMGIFFLDIQQGSILIKGYDLIEFFKMVGYMDIVYFLLEDRFFDVKEKVVFEEDVWCGGYFFEEILYICCLLLEYIYLMDGLRMGLFVFGGFDKDIDDCILFVNQYCVCGLIGKMLNFIVNSYCVINGLEFLVFVGILLYSVNFLYMIIGKILLFLEEEIFDWLFFLYSEYELLNLMFMVCVIVLI